MKTYKPVRRVEKNVIKCLVKENQRVHDYKSPWGVKFWNGILKESKYLAKNHKVFDKNVRIVLDRRLAYYNRELAKEDLDPKKRLIMERQRWQIALFADEEWRTLIQDAGRLYPEKRGVLWKTPEMSEYVREKEYTREEVMNFRDYVFGSVRHLYPTDQNCNNILTEADHI